MSLPEYKRRKLATDQLGVLTPAQYNDAVAVARQLPLLNVEKAFFKVMGERFITTGSLVQLVIKARVIPPGSANVPPVNELDLEDVDPDEGDLDALLGRKSAKSNKKDAKVLEGAATETPSEEKPLQPPLSYAPYFARDRSPRWHVFLADSRLGKIAVPPFTLVTFNKPLHDDTRKPTYNVQTFKMQFQAPPQAGRYPFVMHLVCDSYIGFDSKMDIVLEVEDSAKAAEMADEDEISEPDEGTSPPQSHPKNHSIPHPFSIFLNTPQLTQSPQTDSLAGQMSALKTGGLSGNTPAKKPRKRIQAVEESDDESDTEGEVDEESDTDTDTDTDGE